MMMDRMGTAGRYLDSRRAVAPVSVNTMIILACTFMDERTAEDASASAGVMKSCSSAKSITLRKWSSYGNTCAFQWALLVSEANGEHPTPGSTTQAIGTSLPLGCESLGIDRALSLPRPPTRFYVVGGVLPPPPSEWPFGTRSRVNSGQ